jgi:hypothetical protein
MEAKARAEDARVALQTRQVAIEEQRLRLEENKQRQEHFKLMMMISTMPQEHQARAYALLGSITQEPSLQSTQPPSSGTSSDMNLGFGS